MSKRRKKRSSLLKKLVILIILTHVVTFGFAAIVISSYSIINPPTTSLALYRKYFKHIKNKPFKFVPLNKIPYATRAALIRLEDPNFKYHHGLDLRAMWAAYKINRRFHKKIAGGSTITQQIARTLFLTPHKNYFRKYVEILLALEMEVLLKKDRILELYLNYVEFGKGVYGIGQGAYFHYHRDISKLSNSELARMIIILPSPVRYGVNDLGKRRAFIRRSNILFRPQPEITTPITPTVVKESDTDDEDNGNN